MFLFESSCCFTGYRPEKYDFDFDVSDKRYVEFTRRLISAVSGKILDGCTVFYTGMAKGFDIEAAEYVELIKRRNKNVKLIAVIPFKGQESSWEEHWKKRYYDLLSQCDETVILNEKYEKGVYGQRNRYMVDRCRHVITYYDGKSGGTESTVKYAVKNGREVLNIYNTDPSAKEKSRFKAYYRILPPEE